VSPSTSAGRDPLPVLATTVGTERDVFALRRHAKTIADAVGLDSRDQVRLATAVSELGRDLLGSTTMTVAFTVRWQPAALHVSLQWHDDRRPSSESLAAVTRLLPLTRYEPAAASGMRQTRGGRITLTCLIPETAAWQLDEQRTLAAVKDDSPATAIDDLRAQTRDLITALEEAHAQREELEQLNQELTETNAGVMAMYAELTVEHKDVVERFSQEHELALALQRTFLPAALPETPGAELAVRYLPATASTEIGGDFYEAVQTPQGLLVAVGDVVGHSLKAAVIMGELRHALRAYATQNHPPHVMLRHLDRFLALHQPGWTATVLIVLIEPEGDVLHVANAGHLPPLLLGPDGAPRYLREHGPLLGLNRPHPAAVRHRFEPGSRLVMITDGLIETRDSDLEERLGRLAATASAGPAEPDALCTALVEAFAEDPDDDIIVFAARLHQPPYA
jgi:serine phosphatase RsbU (regulator of sigma subunit)